MLANRVGATHEPGEGCRLRQVRTTRTFNGSLPSFGRSSMTWMQSSTFANSCFSCHPGQIQTRSRSSVNLGQHGTK
jgi:hypothetical protein